MRSILFLTFVLLFSPISLWAQPLPDSELYDYFGEYLRVQNGSDGNSIKAGMFLGYVRGILDALDGTAICVPDNAPLEYLLRKVSGYLQSRSFSQRSAARNLVLDALRDQFPCRK